VAEPMLSPRDAANQTLRELFPDSKGLQSSAEPFDHIPPDVGQGATQGDGRLPSG
jgi:hypothetical protein